MSARLIVKGDVDDETPEYEGGKFVRSGHCKAHIFACMWKSDILSLKFKFRALQAGALPPELRSVEFAMIERLYMFVVISNIENSDDLYFAIIVNIKVLRRARREVWSSHSKSGIVFVISWDAVNYHFFYTFRCFCSTLLYFIRKNSLIMLV